MSPANLAEMLFEAEKAEQAGSWEEARGLYQQALALEPGHLGAQSGLARLNGLERTDEEVQALMAEGEALLASHDYATARNRYRQARNAAAQQGILKYHAALDQKIYEAQDLAAWQERVALKIAEAQRRSGSGDEEGALLGLEQLLNQVPPEPPYERVGAPLKEAIQEIEARQGAEKLYQEARNAFKEQDYERTIRLSENIPPTSSRYGRAQKLLGAAKDQWERFILPFKENIEAQIAQGDWPNAFAELDLFRDEYPESPVWKRLWLQTGMNSGQQALAEGREANTKRAFRLSLTWFEDAHTAFEKVLEVYPTHSTAPRLRDEAHDLKEIAAYQQQAHQAWNQGQRPQAKAALEAARHRIEGARKEGREYVTVNVVVRSVEQSLLAEMALIQEEGRRLQDGARLLEQKRLDDAAQRFKDTLNAFLAEHRERAKEGLNLAESQMQAYEQARQRGRQASDPYLALSALQSAFELWPSAREMPGTLVDGLLRAAEQALSDGRESEALEQCKQALKLDPHNRRAQLLAQKPGIRAKVQAALDQSARELSELNQRPEVGAQAFQAILSRLQHTLAEAQAHPELAAQVEQQRQALEARKRQWEAFEKQAAQAQTQQQAGEWGSAVEALSGALQSFGEVVPPALAEQLAQWRAAAQTVQTARDRSETLWAEAQAAYERSAQEAEHEAPLASLERLASLLSVAANESRAAGGPLPYDLTQRQRQAAELRKRAEAARDAMSAGTALEGLVVLRETTKALGNDPTLDALEAQLNEQMLVEVEALLRQADRALEAGDASGAIEILRRGNELQPENKQIAGRLAAIQRRQRLEEELLDIQLDAETKKETGSLPDARDALRSGLRLLLEATGALPSQARQTLLSLTRLGDQGEALGRPENWNKARDLLLELEAMMVDPSWALEQAFFLAQEWVGLAHDVALRGLIHSSAQLGDLKGAYRAAAAYLGMHPGDPDAVQEFANAQEALLKSVNESADKRLYRAEQALELGNYQTALNNLTSFDEAIYQPVEEEFGNILGRSAAEKVAQAERLRSDAEKLQQRYQEVQPALSEAQRLFTEGRLQEAEAKLQNIPSVKEAPRLSSQLSGLREQVARARQEQSAAAIRQAIVKAQTALRVATTIEQIDQLLVELARLPQEIELERAPIEERNRYHDFLGQVQEEQKARRAGAEWAVKAEEATKAGRYIEAERALKEALAATRDGEKQVALQTRLARVQKKADRERAREEALKQGRAFMLEGQYAQASREFLRAQESGAEVDTLLDLAEAGKSLVSAQNTWPEDLEWALDQLEIARDLVVPHSEDKGSGRQAKQLAREIGSWQRRLKREQTKAQQERERQAQAQAQERERQAQAQALALARQKKINEELSAARRALDSAELDEAQKRVESLLSEEPVHAEGLKLQERVRRTRQAQQLFAQAKAAQEKDDYKTALNVTETILEHVLEDYAPALALHKQLQEGQEAIKVLARARNLARRFKFRDARAALSQALELEAEPSRLRQARELVEKLEREWEKSAERPIRDSFRDQKYREAFKRCDQALEQATSPTFRAEIASLQQDIVNKWSEEGLKELRRRFRPNVDDDALREIIGELAELRALKPQPAAHLARDIRALHRRAVRERLTRALKAAHDLAESGEWADALEQVERLHDEAKSLGLGPIMHQAADLQMDINDWREQSLEGEHEQQRRALFEEIRQALDKAQARKELEQARALAERRLDTPPYKADREARALREQIEEALKRYDLTQEALKDSQRQLLQGQLEEAEKTLRRPRVSSLLRAPYERQRHLIKLLRQAKSDQKKEQWPSAYSHYQQALQQEPALELLLEPDLERCRTKITQQLLKEARAFLTSSPADREPAQALLAQAEQAGWLEPTLDTEIQQLRDWIAGQEHLTQAIEILQKENGDPQEALQALKAAQPYASDADFKGAISQWEQLAQAQLAWTQGQPNKAQTHLRGLPASLAELPRVRKLSHTISRARQITSGLDETRATIDRALSGMPLRPDEAVDAVQEIMLLAKDDPRVLSLRASAQERLQTLMENKRQADHYHQAILLGESLLRLAPEEEQIRAQVDQLPAERAERLAETVQKAEAALQEERLPQAKRALAQAEAIAAPQREWNINNLRSRLEAREQSLQQVDQWLEEAQTLANQAQWEAAIATLENAIARAPRYQPAVNAIENSQKQLAELARQRLAAEQFEQASAWCDLALRLSSREELLALQQEIRAQRQARLAEWRRLAQKAADEWDLEEAQAPLAQGLAIAPSDPTLRRLKERVDQAKKQQGQLQRRMEEGWNTLQQRDYSPAKSAFGAVLKIVDSFVEAQRWLDYTRHMEQASQAVEKEQLKQALPLLESAAGHFAPANQMPLPAVLAESWQERRRQAVYDAHQLAQIAKRMGELEQEYSRLIGLGRKGRSSARKSLVKLLKEKETFVQQHQKATPAPETFQLRALSAPAQEAQPSASAQAAPSSEPAARAQVGASRPPATEAQQKPASPAKRETGRSDPATLRQAQGTAARPFAPRTDAAKRETGRSEEATLRQAQGTAARPFAPKADAEGSDGSDPATLRQAQGIAARPFAPRAARSDSAPSQPLSPAGQSGASDSPPSQPLSPAGQSGASDAPATSKEPAESAAPASPRRARPPLRGSRGTPAKPAPRGSGSTGRSPAKQETSDLDATKEPSRKPEEKKSMDSEQTPPSATKQEIATAPIPSQPAEEAEADQFEWNWDSLMDGFGIVAADEEEES